MENGNTSALYYRVAETLKRRIESRGYHKGEKLPSEQVFSEQFDVSNITIRKAMKILVDDGYIVRKRGAGTRVVYEKDTRHQIKITGNFRDWYTSAVVDQKIEVLNLGLTPCPKKIAKLLSVTEGSPIWQLERVRTINGQPLSYYINFGPPAIFSRLKKRDLEKHNFIDLIQKNCGVKIDKVEQQAEARVADIDVSSILDIKFGAPIFFVELVYYMPNMIPVEVTNIYYSGERYIFKSTIDFNKKK